MVEEEKPIPAAPVEPTDLQPVPGNCFASMIGPMVGLSIKGAIFH
ncbi:MAG: hypothetical protein ACI9UA_000118 [Pseudoalteromonas tetraodonis]|jgi:hypothetical protein